ncbi:MAG TPA: bifunctional aspartate kinase/homoserine dehydrogenase I [Rectinemataceae bacterium]
MRVYKFSGSVLDSHETMAGLLAVVLVEKPEVLVVSAFAGATDSLVEIGKMAESRGSYSSFLERLGERHRRACLALLDGEKRSQAISKVEVLLTELRELLHGVSLVRDLSMRTLDQIMGYGERLSASIIAMALEARGLDVEYVESSTLLRTDSRYGSARVLEDDSRVLIRSKLPLPGKLAVVTGFMGSTSGGVLTTLGRGGSDLVATTIAAALDAEEAQIFTDSPGVMTAEAALVPDAFAIEEISYAEALEMTHFGARALSPISLKPVMAAGVPIRVRDGRHPEARGTRIVEKAGSSAYPVRGLASIPSLALLSIHGLGLPGVTGISGRMFSALAGARVNVILITQASSELSICCAIDPADLGRGIEALAEEFSSEISAGLIDFPSAEKELSVIAVVGEQMKQRAGISGRVFSALGRNGVNVVAIAQGSSELNISIVVQSRDRAKALGVIHDAFFLAGIRTVNLFLAGVGLIGSTLLKQIAAQKDKLLKHHSIRVRLAGIINSRSMVVSPSGIDVERWKEALDEGQPADMGAFVDLMKALNLPSACFCDCTASETPPAYYQGILEAAIAVVTPNKRANAGPVERYKAIKRVMRERDVVYGYETTVGAGLPVIGTLHDLVACGDSITRIEAVLSGTISFIFNGLGTGKSFSSLVLEAKARGYTEPDPRDDLGAVDIARKTLILIREAGIPLDFPDIRIEPILPDRLTKASTVAEFLALLPEIDAGMEARAAQAASRGKVLRYVSTITQDSAELALREYGPESPFYNLSATDNLVMFSTARYSANPLVVRGPGAGAEVTAGGVFADILKTAQSYL